MRCFRRRELAFFALCVVAIVLSAWRGEWLPVVLITPALTAHAVIRWRAAR